MLKAVLKLSAAVAIGLSQAAFPAAAQAPNTAAATAPVGTAPTSDGPVPNVPATPPRGDGNGSTSGLPDAVTILNILWSMPQRPLGPSGSSDQGPGYGPPSDGPKPRGHIVELPPQPPPRPVLTAAPGVPFVPKPVARPAGSSPASLGAIAPEMREREVIVTLVPGSSAVTVAELARDFGLQGDTLYTSALLGTRVVRLRIPDARSVADVLQQIAGDARVDFGQPNYVFTASGAAAGAPPVPQYATQKIHIEEAHKLASGKRVKIAVIDTGVDAAHPVFAGAVHETFNALGTAAQAEPHGTAIAGIVGARSGFVGIAPDADLLSARAFTVEKSGPAQSDTLAVLKSLDWSAARGARVVNMSFAGPQDPLLGRAIDAAVKSGMIVVAAAGNGGPEAKPAYPAAFANVIAVSATDDADKPYTQANRGTYIAVAAPGVDVVAPAPKGAYDISSGTSLAAAHVSGIAALMLEREPKLQPADVRARLAAAAHNPNKQAADIVGAGVVDAAEAVKTR